MLMGFSVGNFKSFKDNQSISLVASRISRHGNHVIERGGKRILKSSLVFGANAGGKSNLVKAVDFSTNIILHGIANTTMNKAHFRIDSSMYEQPGYFEYDIMIGEQEYEYGLVVSYSRKIVLGEWLIRKESDDKEVYIFNREYDEVSQVSSMVYDEIEDEEDRIYFKSLLTIFGKNISDFNMKNTILMDIARRHNQMDGIIGEIQRVFEWFEEILIIYPESVYGELGDITTQEKVRVDFNEMILGFDTGIERIQSASQVMDFDDFVKRGMPRDVAEKMKAEWSNKVDSEPVTLQIGSNLINLHKSEDGTLVYNKILFNHGNEDDPFDFEDESDGTRRLFDLLPLFQLDRKPRLVLIDEIDRSLHTNLTRKFLELFYDRTEAMDTQLIATTHDSYLMDLQFLRQDEYWFVEREPDHSSRLYSLDDFKERFDKRIDKEYRIGRYGAIPVFSSELSCDY